MTLSEFLLARIAEDEAVAQGLADDYSDPLFTEDMCWIRDGDQIVVAVGIGRALAECEAKRLIVQGTWGRADVPAGFNEGLSAGIDFACKMLAQPYADHADFREEWRLTDTP